MNSLSELMYRVMNGKTVEPVKRVKSLFHVQRGFRNFSVLPSNISHKYEIINGITRTQLLLENIEQNNALFAKLRAVK